MNKLELAERAISDVHEDQTLSLQEPLDALERLSEHIGVETQASQSG